MTQAKNLPAVELGTDRPYPPMVEFIQPDGSSESFRYEDFRRVRYFPEGRLELRFAAAIINIHGRNLLPVWRAVRSRRVRLLRAGSAAVNGAGVGHEPQIDSISIADRVMQSEVLP